MSRNRSSTSHDELIQNYLENETTPTEERQFRLLLGDESFRRQVAEYAIDLGHLHEHARQGRMERVLTIRHRSVSRTRRRALAVVVAAASVLIVVGAVWRFSLTSETLPDLARESAATGADDQPAAPTAESAQKSPKAAPASPPTAPVVVARVTDVAGRVLTGAGSGSAPRTAVQKGATLRSGDVLQTVGADSFALVKFDDDSALFVTGNTELECSIVDSQKRIGVLRGDITAQVARQPLQPMVIRTPAAEAEVVGTCLTLFANSVLTELAVLEGQVQLKRLSDEQFICVEEGECAVASSTSELVAKPISPVPNVWEEDFEEKWPDRWRAGHWIRYALPPGSKGAVRAALQDEDGGPAFISSPNEWSHGLFRIENDTYLNLTYKVKEQGWFYIMLETRSEDYSGAYRGHYMYQPQGHWKVQPRKWHTVTIPLSDFHVPQRSQPQNTSLAPPKVGEVVFSLFLRTQERDPGLFVDRLWVTKGPAEGAMLLETP